MIKILKEFKNSKNPADRLFYLQCLKEFGKIGKRIYKLNNSEQTKKDIIIIKNLIENYEIYTINI